MSYTPKYKVGDIVNFTSPHDKKYNTKYKILEVEENNYFMWSFNDDYECNSVAFEKFDKNSELASKLEQALA